MRRRTRWGLSLVGVLIAAGGAAALNIAGLSPYRGMVVGLALGLPVLNVAGTRFDADAYLDSHAGSAIAIDFVLTIVVGLVVGLACLSIALAVGIRNSGLLVVIGAVGTIGGGSGTFLYRNSDHYEWTEASERRE